MRKISIAVFALCLVACTDPSQSPLGKALVGHWHEAQDPTKLLQFSSDGTYYDTSFEDWTSLGYQCTGAYSVDGYKITLEETCPKVTPAQGAPLPCRYVKDILALGVDGASLSVTTFHRDGGGSGMTGSWKHHSERWRELLNADGACSPTQMEESDDLTLTLKADDTYDYTVTSQIWNTNTQQYDMTSDSHDGTYAVSGAEVALVNAPVAPMQLLGDALAPGEMLYSRD
jgi:hypothetical protein